MKVCGRFEFGVLRFGSYVNFLGFKIFGLVFLFNKLLDLNSCEF